MSESPKREPDVLDRNLTLLLTRAYVPVRPSAAFRAALSFSLNASQRARVPAVSTRSLSRSTPRRTVALRLAAAVIVLALGAFFVARALSGGSTVHDCDELLARGDVAVRKDGGAWRAFDARERANGLQHDAGALELATPRDHGALVWLAGAGSAAFESESRASLELGADGANLALDFSAGSLALERLAAGGAWRVHTTQGDFELARGKLELAYVGPEFASIGRSVRAKLVWGAATFFGEGGAIELTPGDAEVVRAQHVLDLAPLESEVTARTGAASTETAAPGTASSPATTPTTATLHADLWVSEGDVVGGPWRLTVMRTVRLPEVGQPRTTTFAADARQVQIDGLEPGTYEVFVSVPGFGDNRWSDVTLGPGDSPALTFWLKAPAHATGRVVDAETGAPIEGAFVVSETDAPAAVLPYDFSAMRDESWRTWTCLTRTDADGRFELASLSSGRGHYLRASAPGRAASWSKLFSPVAGASGEDFVLRLGRPGRILAQLSEAGARGGNAQNSDPLVIASRVDLATAHHCYSYGVAWNAVDGRATVEDLAPGLYVVFELVDGRPSPRMRQVVVNAGATTELSFGENRRGARLHGTLRLADGAPAADIDLSLMPANNGHETFGAGSRWINERSDAVGRFAFPELEPGTYEIYAGRGVGTQFSALGTLDVPDVKDLERDLVLGPCELAGTVRRVDSEPRPEVGKPMPNAQIVLERDDGGTWTFAGRYVADASGSWHAEFLTPGRLRVTAFTTNDRLAPGTAGPFELTPLSPRPVRADVDLERGVALLVIAHDAANTRLAGVVLEFSLAGGTRQRFSENDATDERGQFVINGMVAGKWTIRASREGFRPVTRTIVLAGINSQTMIELELEREDAFPPPVRERR